MIFELKLQGSKRRTAVTFESRFKGLKHQTTPFRFDFHILLSRMNHTSDKEHSLLEQTSFLKVTSRSEHHVPLPSTVFTLDKNKTVHKSRKLCDGKEGKSSNKKCYKQRGLIWREGWSGGGRINYDMRTEEGLTKLTIDSPVNCAPLIHDLHRPDNRWPCISTLCCLRDWHT